MDFFTRARMDAERLVRQERDKARESASLFTTPQACVAGVLMGFFSQEAKLRETKLVDPDDFKKGKVITSRSSVSDREADIIRKEECYNAGISVGQAVRRLIR